MERSASASHSGSNPKFWVLTSKYFIIKSNLKDKRILIQIYFNNDLFNLPRGKYFSICK